MSTNSLNTTQTQALIPLNRNYFFFLVKICTSCYNICLIIDLSFIQFILFQTLIERIKNSLYRYSSNFKNLDFEGLLQF